MTTTCRAKNPASCRHHGQVTVAEEQHLEKEKFFNNGFVAAQQGDNIFSSKETERSQFLRKRIYMYGTENAWEISPEGFTGANCKCGAYLTREQTQKLSYSTINCTICQEQIYGATELAPPNLSYEAARFTDEEEVRKASWFHITTDPEWASNVSENENPPVIHVGTENAAQDRLTMIQDDLSWKAKVYMYEVKLKPELEILPEIRGDGNSFQPKCAAERDIEERNKVVRYLNAYEDIGSISLLIEGNLFEVVNRKEMTAHEEY